MLAEGSQEDDQVERILSGMGCDVVCLWSPQHALEALSRSEPDLIVLDNTTSGSGNVGVVQHLRDSGALPASVPIVAIVRGDATEEEQLALQQGGIWDVYTQPLNCAAFEARLHNFLSARRAHLEARDATLLDSLTGLYTRRGLDVRVSELAAHCARQGALLSCVAFTLSATTSVSRSVQLQSDSLAAIGMELRRIGRSSDTIGRVDDCEFVVLAPGATGGDARQLANRLTRSVTALLDARGVACDAPWVGRVLQPSRNVGQLGEELLSDTLLALQEVTAEHEIPAST